MKINNQLEDKLDGLGLHMLRIKLVYHFVPVKEATTCMLVSALSQRGLEHI